MKILYVTDLHGKWYKEVEEIVEKHNPDIIINGGDMLPGATLEIIQEQEYFIEHIIKPHFKRIQGIPYICMLGNDDCSCNDYLFEEACNKFGVYNIAFNSCEVAGYTFVGYNNVPDHPFGIKDRSRLDFRGDKFGIQWMSAWFSQKNGISRNEFVSICDLQEYLDKLPSIEEELNTIKLPIEKDKMVFVCHTPPAGIRLDVCADGRQVGSRAVANFIEKNQPLLSLHGHIHEMNSKEYCYKSINKTICIQPGQATRFNPKMIYVIVETEDMGIKTIDRFAYP